MIRLPPRPTPLYSSAASDVYKRQHHAGRAPDDLLQARQQLRRHAQAFQALHSGAAIEQAHRHRFAVLRRHGRYAHVDAPVAYAHVETPVLRQAFFGNVQTRHELDPLHQGGGDLDVGFGLQLQHAIDAEANLQQTLLRLDMDVGRVHLGRILEHGLQQFDDRRILRARLNIERTEIHGLAHVRTQFACEIGDLLGAPVDPVYGLEHLVFVDQDELDVALQRTRDFVICEQVGGIAHRHQVRVALVLHQQGAKTPCQQLGQHARHLKVDVVVLEVEVGDLELFGQRLGNALLCGEAVFDQHPTELAAAALLLLEG